MNAGPTPSDEQLRAFLLGELDEASAQQIESHLEKSPEIQRRLEAVDVSDDPVMRSLADVSRQGTSAPFATEDMSWAKQQIGTTLGKYRLEEVLGRGAMGVVFRAQDTATGNAVALKLLSPAVGFQADIARRFLSEARAAGQLDHPHVISVYGTGQHDATPFLAMELAAGGTVSERIRSQGAWPWREATRLMIEACEGVAAAHLAGLIHRDLKPGNLLLTEDERVKVADFGLVKWTTEETITATGQFMGTPHYSSPEQFEGAAVDVRSDIYSLGATYYALLTGEKPYADRSTPSQVMFAHLRSDVPDPRQDNPDLPTACAWVISRAMAKARGERYPDCAAMLADLKRVLDEDVDALSEKSEAALRWQKLSRLPDGPTIAVLPFANPAGDEQSGLLSGGITEETITQLAKFQDLHILARSATAAYTPEETNIKQIGQELGVSYLLTGSVRRSADRLRITAQLLDTSTEAHVWAKSFRGNLSTQDVFEIEDEIAEQVAISLGLHDGAIARARLDRKIDVSADISAYDSVSRYYENWRAENPLLLYAQVRGDLEATVKREPGYSAAWAALAFVYLDSFVWDFTDDPPEKLLAWAGDAAGRALEGSPQDARALHATFRFQYHSGQFDAFMATAERALDANPNEANMLADLANCLACKGDWARSLALTRKALALNPNPPDWYHVTKCWHALATGDFETAFAEADRMRSVGVYWGPALRACALGHLDRLDEARQELAVLAQLQPNFAERFATEMQAWHVNDALRDATFAGFAKIGLGPPPGGAPLAPPG